MAIYCKLLDKENKLKRPNDQSNHISQDKNDLECEKYDCK
jgi:hypothetical protein